MEQDTLFSLLRHSALISFHPSPSFLFLLFSFSFFLNEKRMNSSGKNDERKDAEKIKQELLLWEKIKTKTLTVNKDILSLTHFFLSLLLVKKIHRWYQTYQVGFFDTQVGERERRKRREKKERKKRESIS